VLLAATPPLVCVLVLCAVGGALLMPPGGPTATPTVAGQQETRSAEETALRQGQAGQAAQTATAAQATRQASDRASATAAAAGRLQSLTEQALTQAALPSVTVRPSNTPTFDPSNLPPTRTPTPPAVVTLTLIECRGQEGTVTFDRSSSQSLHAYGRISFTVPRGVHHLQVFWLNNPGQNVDTDLDLQRDTAMVFGDPC
jgi:hypothetical protein